jgi:hypothetical protein
MEHLRKSNMKLHVLCDCDNNKVCVGNWNGKPMWHFRKDYDNSVEYQIVNIKENWKKNDEWFKDEAYKQNSD